MDYGRCLTAMSKSVGVAIITMGLAASSLCAGQETVLHTFVNKADGNSPGGGLTFDTKGNLFGTTSVGGTGEFADGTAFELTPKASGGFTFHTIHQFSAATGDGWLRRLRSSDGSSPIAILAASSSLPSGEADGLVGRDETASARSIISGESRVNEGMAFVLYCAIPNGNRLLDIPSNLRRG